MNDEFSLKELLEIRENLNQMKWDNRLEKPKGYDALPKQYGKRKTLFTKRQLGKWDVIFQAKDSIENSIENKKKQLFEEFLVLFEEID